MKGLVPPAATAKAAGRPVPSLLLIAGISVSWPVAINIFLPAVPDISAAFAVDASRAQMAFSLGLMAFGIAQLGFGPLVDKLGRRPMLLAALLVFLVGSIVGAFAPTLEMVIAARIVQSAGVGGLFVLGRVFIRDLYTGVMAGHAMSRMAMIITVGPMLVPILGGLIVGLAGWRYTFGFAAVFSLLLLVWSWQRAGETQRMEDRGTVKFADLRRQYAKLLADPVYRSYVMAATFVSNGFFTIMTLLPVLFIQDLGVPPAAYGFCLLGMTMGLTAGGFVSTRRVVKVGIDGMIRRGLVISSIALVSLLALSPWPSVAAVIVPLFFYMLGHGISFPLSVAAATEVDARVVGAATAVLGAISQLLIGVLTVAAAQWHDGTGLPLATVCLISNILAWSMFLLARRLKAERHRRQPAS